LNYIDFLRDVLLEENQKLKDELIKYKKENESLKNKINKLNDDINKLNEELNNKTTNINSKIDINTNNIISSLNEIIKSKDKEINDLKSRRSNNEKKEKLFKFDDIIVINFSSFDKNINCGIKCLKTDTFAEVEEKLYQKYEKYRDTDNHFVINGKKILRFKKICENNIRDGDNVHLKNKI